MSGWPCPKCGRDNTTIVSHKKWSVELFCFHCGEFIEDVKENKLRVERANPGLFNDEEL